MCCSVLQVSLEVKASSVFVCCVGLCCSVLQCVAVCCSVLQCVAVRCISAFLNIEVFLGTEFYVL